ncbi:MAG: hypothetical protein ABSG73_05965 [Candidatus Aminicenantales bacterium]|jgi:hypothetical protein
MTDQEQSGYYQAIAREFLRRRGAPFFLSPRDLAVIDGWEKNSVPLHVVLEGVGRAFDGIRDRARGTKGISVSFCEPHVGRALAQHTDRAAGRRRTTAPRAAKVARARGQVEAYLHRPAADDRRLRSLFEEAAGLLAREVPDEEALEKIDDGVGAVLWSRTSRTERDGLARRTAKEFPGKGPAEIAAAVRTRSVKSAREKLKIPYVSLFYY